MSTYLDVSKLKRDPAKIKNKLKKSGSSYIAKEKLSILFPDRFLSKNLCTIDIISFVFACFCILDEEGNYSIMNDIVMIPVKPDRIEKVNIDKKGTSYVKMVFDKDSVVISNNKLIQDASLLYSVTLEFFYMGKIPWYLDQKDVSRTFRNSSELAGNKLGDDPVGLQMLSSLLTKGKDGITLYRHEVNTEEDLLNKKPNYVGLNKVSSYDDTAAKFVSGRLEEGLTSATTNPEEESSDSSILLRS